MPFWRSLGLDLRGGLRCGELRVRWGVGVSIADSHVDSYFRFFMHFLRFGSDFGTVLDGLGARKSDFLLCYTSFLRFRVQV